MFTSNDIKLKCWDGLRCPMCGGALLKHESRDTHYQYRGRTTTINVTGAHCDACGDCILDRDSKCGEQTQAFREEVDRELDN